MSVIKRTCSNIVLCIMQTIHSLRENRRKIGIFTALMVCLIAGFVQNDRHAYMAMYALPTSVADSCLLMTYSTYNVILMMPFFLMMLAGLLDEKFSVQTVLRCRTRKIMWGIICCKITALSLFVAVFTMLSACTGIFAGEKLINWTEEKSRFWSDTKTVLKINVPFWNILALCILSVTLACILAGFAFIIIKRIFNSTAAGVMAGIGWGIIDGRHGKGLVMERLTVSYDRWISKNDLWLMPAVLCLFALLAISLRMEERREYY